MEKHTRNYLLAVRLPLAVLMACYVWTGWTELRQICRMDEMRRRLAMEAMVLAFIACSGMILLLYFVRVSKLADVPFALAPMVPWSCYLLARPWARLRYRYWSL